MNRGLWWSHKSHSFMNFLWQTGIRVTPIEADQQCLQFFMRNSFAKSLTRSHGFQIFSIDYRSNRFFSSTTATKLIRRILVQSDEASFMDQWSLFSSSIKAAAWLTIELGTKMQIILKPQWIFSTKITFCITLLAL